MRFGFFSARTARAELVGDLGACLAHVSAITTPSRAPLYTPPTLVSRQPGSLAPMVSHGSLRPTRRPVQLSVTHMNKASNGCPQISSHKTYHPNQHTTPNTRPVTLAEALQHLRLLQLSVMINSRSDQSS